MCEEFAVFKLLLCLFDTLSFGRGQFGKIGIPIFRLIFCVKPLAAFLDPFFTIFFNLTLRTVV